MSYDLYVYVSATEPLDPQVIMAATAKMGVTLRLHDAFNTHDYGLVTIMPGQTGSEAPSADFTFLVRFEDTLGETEVEELRIHVGEMEKQVRLLACSCRTRYHVFFAGLPTPGILTAMDCLATVIARLSGGIYEDPQTGWIRTFSPADTLPVIDAEPTAKELVGPLGMLAVQFCNVHGYAIPRAFLRGPCERFVFLITSLNPPKINAQTLAFDFEVYRFLENAPPGYVYRVFDFQQRVEVQVDLKRRTLTPIASINGIRPPQER